jgi:hypothetical protein
MSNRTLTDYALYNFKYIIVIRNNGPFLISINLIYTRVLERLKFKGNVFVLC